MAAQSIFKITNVDLSLWGGGRFMNPAVASIAIDLRENAIPEITCVIDPDPSHMALRDDGGKIPDAIQPSLSSLKQYSDNIQAMALDLESTASLTFDIVDIDDVVLQSLELTGWRVVGGGIQDAAASGGFALGVTIQHGVSIADQATANIGNSGDSDARNTGATGGILDSYITLLTRWATPPRIGEGLATISACSTGISDGAPVAAAARSRLVTTLARLGEKFLWAVEWPNNTPGYTAWPLERTCLADATLDTRAKVLYNSIPSLGDASPWETLVANICSEYCLTVIPTYWKDALTVIPASPWGHPVITVYDDEVSAVTLPPADPAPCAGARISFSMADNSFDMTELEDQESIARASMGSTLWVPDGVAAGKTAGRLVTANIPSFIPETLMASSAIQVPVQPNDPGFFGGTGDLDPDGAGTGSGSGMSTSGSAGNTAAQLDKVTGSAARYAKQLFLTYFRSATELNFTTYLCVQKGGSSWDGEWVIPGCVARLKSRDDDSVLFDFYLWRVVHIIDVGGRQAVTQWYGRYARPSDGCPGMAINGTYNPLYLPA